MPVSCVSAVTVLAISASAIAETHTVLANNTSFSPDAIDVAPGDDNHHSPSGDGSVVVLDVKLDCNGNGDVDDVLLILSNWGSSGPLADVDYDGIVGVNDILALLSSWDSC